ncbi:hypothetical protein D3C72_1684830 [compost metagenome]
MPNNLYHFLATTRNSLMANTGLPRCRWRPALMYSLARYLRIRGFSAEPSAGTCYHEVSPCWARLDSAERVGWPVRRAPHAAINVLTGCVRPMPKAPSGWPRPAHWLRHPQKPSCNI